MTGTDVVYKDVIEPLESVSVALTKTDKADITEFGDIKEVCAVKRLQQAGLCQLSNGCWLRTAVPSAGRLTIGSDT